MKKRWVCMYCKMAVEPTFRGACPNCGAGVPKPPAYEFTNTYAGMTTDSDFSGTRFWSTNAERIG